jgi:hypothetical protein
VVERLNCALRANVECLDTTPFLLSDLSFSEGKEDESFGRLQQKLGKTKEAIRDEIEKL